MTDSPAPSALRHPDRAFYAFTAVVSTAALALLTWLLVVREVAPGADGPDLRFMPAVNACLNAVAATLLVGGWVAIRRGNRALHQRLMVAAFAASSLFLVGYLAYHAVHGDTRYVGEWRTAYLVLLASHVLLSVPVVPMALLAFWFAWRKEFTRHRKVTRWLAPIWVYVSVTGVLVYFALRGSAGS